MRLLDKSRTGAHVDRDRPLEPDADADRGGDLPAERLRPRHRADRLGKVDHRVRGSRRHSPSRSRHRDDRGSCRVSPRRRLPDAGGSPGGAHLCLRSPCHPPQRSRCRHGRRDPGCRDGQAHARSGADGPLGPLDLAHERRRRCGHPPERARRRALRDRIRRVRGARSAARAPPVPFLPEGVSAERRRPGVARILRGGDSRRGHLVPADRLLGVLQGVPRTYGRSTS